MPDERLVSFIRNLNSAGIYADVHHVYSEDDPRHLLKAAKVLHAHLARLDEWNTHRAKPVTLVEVANAYAESHNQRKI